MQIDRAFIFESHVDEYSKKINIFAAEISIYAHCVETLITIPNIDNT